MTYGLGGQLVLQSKTEPLMPLQVLTLLLRSKRRHCCAVVLAGVVTETKNGAGTVTARTQVDYRYDNAGIRFIAKDYTQDLQTSNFTLQTSSEYLIDHSNFTGYQQTIIETQRNASGQATKRISYTIGLDAITQTTSTIDPVTGLVQGTPATLTFGHDGHGSTRALFGALAAFVQVFTYTAFGELLAIHTAAGTRDATNSAVG